MEIKCVSPRIAQGHNPGSPRVCVQDTRALPVSVCLQDTRALPAEASALTQSYKQMAELKPFFSPETSKKKKKER